MYGCLFLCSHLNLQEDSCTDGSAQKDLSSLPSSESNNYSDECGLNKPLLSSPGTSSLSADLSHFTQVLCKLCMGQFIVVISQRSCIGSLYYNELYTRFVDCCLVDSRFVYTLNTKTSYSWLTKPKTPKLNAKTGGLCPPEPLLNCLWLAISNWSAKIQSMNWESTNWTQPNQTVVLVGKTTGALSDLLLLIWGGMVWERDYQDSDWSYRAHVSISL